ncbi:hypothetical protein JKP88DRAFT_348303 [Tribonema minus]|uniref:Yip1 domain-containing protein n=1 Tax=Tribonema minus TaxID=303371 RepID=A0A835Z8E5_9STRA|nr:hypothetical protein JKP88DRAFT_348303 [Tribonema minus]
MNSSKGEEEKDKDAAVDSRVPSLEAIVVFFDLVHCEMSQHRDAYGLAATGSLSTDTPTLSPPQQPYSTAGTATPPWHGGHVDAAVVNTGTPTGSPPRQPYSTAGTSTPPWVTDSPAPPPHIGGGGGGRMGSPSTPQQAPQQAASVRGSLCGCFTVEYYKPYFNVDTGDVYKRWLGSMLFCRRQNGFVELMGENPDAYGPFWNATTLVFLVAVTTNLSSWLAFNGDQWYVFVRNRYRIPQYDFQKVVTCSAIVYGFGAVVPLLVWAAFRQLDVKLSLIHVLCTHGYGQAVFLPAALICAVPNGMFSTPSSWNQWIHFRDHMRLPHRISSDDTWRARRGCTALYAGVRDAAVVTLATCAVALGVAAVMSTLFLLRTLTPPVMEHNPTWAMIIVGVLVAEQVTFAMLLKFLFYYQ